MPFWIFSKTQQCSNLSILIQFGRWPIFCSIFTVAVSLGCVFWKQCTIYFYWTWIKCLRQSILLRWFEAKLHDWDLRTIHTWIHWLLCRNFCCFNFINFEVYDIIMHEWFEFLLNVVDIVGIYWCMQYFACDNQSLLVANLIRKTEPHFSIEK